MKNSGYIHLLLLICFSAQTLSSDNDHSQSTGNDVVPSDSSAMEVIAPPSTPTVLSNQSLHQQDESLGVGGNAFRPISTSPQHSPLRFISRLNNAPKLPEVKPSKQPQSFTIYKKKSIDTAKIDTAKLVALVRQIDLFNSVRTERNKNRQKQQAHEKLESSKISSRGVDEIPFIPATTANSSSLMGQTAALTALTGVSLGAAFAGREIYTRRTRGIITDMLTDPTGTTTYIKVGIGIASSLLVIGVVSFGITKLRMMIGNMKDAIQHGFQANSLLRSQADQRVTLLEEQLNRLSAQYESHHESVQEDVTHLSELVRKAILDINSMIQSAEGLQRSTEDETRTLQALQAITEGQGREIARMKLKYQAQEERVKTVETLWAKKKGR